jgi:hypothetical protein
MQGSLCIRKVDLRMPFSAMAGNCYISVVLIRMQEMYANSAVSPRTDSTYSFRNSNLTGIYSLVTK